MFRWYFHPISGAHTTVSTASGICHTVTAICRYRGRVGTAVDGVGHPQHIQTGVTKRAYPEAEGGTVDEKCPVILLNADSHVTFRDLLHAVKLRHGTDGVTSPSKEGVLRIFSP
jgi:hypothetical protein